MSEALREANLRALNEELDGTAERRMPWQAPSAFVTMDWPERTPQERAADDLRAAGYDYTGWPDAMPKPFQVNAITYRMQVSPQMLADAGVDPGEGYVPWQPPPLPWHRRWRNRAIGTAWLWRKRLASRLAGFDVDDRE